MRQTISRFFLCTFVLSASLMSCKKDHDAPAQPTVADQSFTEEFDTLSSAIARGWKLVNASDPTGPGTWVQGGDSPAWFTAFSNKGTNAGFVGVDYTSTAADAGEISNWLLSPEITFQNGDKVSFYTRTLLYDTGTGDSTDYANRLQLRMSTSEESAEVGKGAYNVGAFDRNLVDVNPYYLEYHTDPAQHVPNAYPGNWTKFEVTINGLAAPVKGRLGFRYLLEGGGYNGMGSGVAIDKFQYTSVNH